MITTRAAFCVLAIFGSAAAQAQCPSTFRSLTPDGRDRHAMVFDPRRNVVVLFGGLSSGVLLGDTWELGDAGWKQRAVTGPAPRAGHSMAFDATRGETILYGGTTTLGQPGVSETWAWDGTSWQILDVVGAGPSEDDALTFDPVRERVVLVRSASSANPVQTWDWNGSQWTRLTTLNAPPRATRPGLVFDSSRGRLVLHAGTDPLTQGTLRETWEFDGHTWTQVDAAGPSSPAPAMAFDTVRGVTVLFGVIEGGISRDAWDWDGAAWVKRLLNGPSLPGAVMVYDSSRSMAVMFGRTAQTWSIASPPPPTITQQPQGVTVCSGGPVGLSVAATGNGALNYQWRRGGAPIAGAVAAAFNIAAATPEQSGIYDVVVTDACGSTLSAPVSVLVKAPPAIAVEPQSVTVECGQTATLTVTASGASPLSYQWRRNGLSLPGETAATLVLPNRRLGQSANYDVVVSNACGSATSAAAGVTVKSITGDINGDGRVDQTDIDLFLLFFGSCRNEPPVPPDPLYLPLADFDNSGCIDGNDFDYLLFNYGRQCPP